MTTSKQSTPATPPAPAPRQPIGTAHRLEDGRVLTTAAEHEQYARELAMLATEDAALAAATPSTPAVSRPSSEALTDG